MAGSSSAKTRFALLPGHDEENALDYFAKPVIGRAFARPVGSQ
jgi:hypothetical protein